MDPSKGVEWALGAGSKRWGKDLSQVSPPYTLPPNPTPTLYFSAFDSSQALDQVTKSAFLQRSEGVEEGARAEGRGGGRSEEAEIGENME